MLTSLLRQARDTSFALMHATGLTERVENSNWRSNRLMVLGYHGVSLRDEHEWDPNMYCTPEFVRRRFEVLRERKYTVLPLDEAFVRLHQHTLPPRSVVLTFDDGFYNFHKAALPLLQEFQFPATVYLSTFHCIHQRPLTESTIRYLLWRARRKRPEGIGTSKQWHRPDLSNRDECEQVTQTLLSDIARLGPDDSLKSQWLGDLATTLGESWDDVLQSRIMHLMTEAEVSDCASLGIDIQLHTHRHRMPNDEALFRDEINTNRSLVEALSGRPTTHFCYPSGQHSPEHLAWMRNMQITTATTCEPGIATEVSQPLLIPRFIDTMVQSEARFIAWIAGAGAMAALSGRSN